MFVAPHEALTVGCGGGASKDGKKIETIGLIILFVSFLVNFNHDRRSIIFGLPSLLLSFFVTYHSSPALCHTISWTCRGTCQIMCTGASFAHAICEHLASRPRRA